MHKRETQPQLLKEALEFLEMEWLWNKFIENVCYLWFQSSSTRSLSGSLPLQKHKRELSRFSSPLDPSVIICMFEYDLYVFSVISIRAGGKDFCLDLLLYSTFISIVSPCYCRATLFSRFAFVQSCAVFTVSKDFDDCPKNNFGEGNKKASNQPNINHLGVGGWRKLFNLAREYSCHH